MKSIKLLGLALILGLIMTSCKKDPVIAADPVETQTVTNLYAPADVRDHQTGEVTTMNEYVYFDFSTGKTVDKTAGWDIAFKGTSIIVNGGVNGTGNVSVSIVTSTFADLKEVPSADQFKQDTESGTAIPSGSGNGWYNYNPTNHLITPIAGKIIVVKTSNGNYAKMEILSYYENAPINPDPSVDKQDTFTFNYAYQKNGTGQF